MPEPHEVDSALVQRVVAGDRAAFTEVIEHHQGAVFGYLRARVLQPIDAEDLTQEVFLRFYLTRARFDSGNLIRPWLLGIARNLLREHARRQKRQKEIAWTELCLELEDMVNTDEDLYEDVLVHLPSCMESLGQSAREAIQLRYRGNLRLAAIGERLKRSEGAVKLLMFRARQALKHCLDTRVRSGSHD